VKQILKTTILLAALSALFVAIGYAVGGRQGMIYAFGLSAVMNFGSYWFSDKIVLKMKGATPVDRADAPVLYSIVEELAAKDNVPMPKVYIVDDPTPNAFATGRNIHHAAVAAHTGILDILTKDELKGVLAHELGHVKNHDILISTIAATTAGAIGLMAQLARFGGGLGGGNSNNNDQNRQGNPVFGLIALLVAPLAATLIQLAISRSREYQADEHGAHLIGDGDPLARALAKLRDYKANNIVSPTVSDQVTGHLMFANMFNAGALSGLFSTHPPLEDRIARLNKL
jgi:heat shock protein HtpX